MKFLPVVILLATHISCSNSKLREYQIPINVRYTVNLSLPADFDTLLIWQKQSDYHCGDQQYYRIQNSQCGVDLERGFLHEYQTKVFRQLTITHSLHPECRGKTGLKLTLSEWLKAQTQKLIEENISISVLVADSLEIDGQEFGKVGVELHDSKAQSQTERKLIFASEFDGQWVEFEFLSSLPPDTNFIYDMTKYFESLRINQANHRMSAGIHSTRAISQIESIRTLGMFTP